MEIFGNEELHPSEEINVEEIVYFVHRKGDFVSPHKHNVYEILLYNTGGGRTGFMGEEYEYTDKTIQVIPPGVYHSEMANRETVTLCCLLAVPEVFAFKPTLVYADEKNAVAFSQIESTLKHLARIWFTEYAPDEKVVDMLPEVDDDGMSLRDHAYALLLNVNNLLEDHGKPEYQKNAVEYTKSYIKQYYVNKINYALLAEQHGYSYDRFRCMFKQYTGITLKQYQLGIQLTHAKTYISATKWPIKKIAKKCGFRSDVRFECCFKEKFGISPCNYRKMMKEHPNIRVINSYE